MPVPKADLPVKLPDDVEFDRPGNPLDRHPTWRHVALPAMRQGGAARNRHDGHVRRFVLVFRPLHRTLGRTSRPIPKRGQRLAAGRPVYRRHRARDPAPALFALLHPRDEGDRPSRSRASRSRACSRKAWWCTRPTSGSRTALGDAGRGHGSRRSTASAARSLIATGEADRDRLDREDVEVEEERRSIPDDIIASYGADTARWFMLSDSPPERDVIWTEAGVEGAHRFVQRVWRLVSEAAPDARRRRRRSRLATARPARFPRPRTRR